jgi:hypothetical protein
MEMKTTLNVDDRLLRQAKKVALERGITLTRLFEDALRAAIAQPRRTTRFRLHWDSVQGRRAPEIDIADRCALYDLMEPPRIVARRPILGDASGGDRGRLGARQPGR